ncbi:MAG: chromosomal replication initiator protein DnaA [Clostridia bacterium]
MESFNEAWDLICDYCKTQTTDIGYTTWFSRLIPISLDFEKGVAIIEAPNEFHKQTLERCYQNLISEAFTTVFGISIDYKIMVHEEIVKQEEKISSPGEYYDLTFQTFIVGPSNNFAHAACVAVATKPAQIYNPLFIYGNSGLGKTHLLNAISTEIHKNNSSLNIVYVKGDEFTNELIEAIQKGTTAAFREKYRKADVLLMDDIQFIGGKESTQEEFFHTFNTLYESRKQIILASDRPPKDIATLEDRIKGRFEWGLTADVQPPNYETRIAIIKRKAELLEINIPSNVCEFIANKLKSNIRQLEGIVKKMKAYYLLEGKAPSIITAQNAISDIFKDEESTPITIDKILEEVGRTYGCTKEDIESSKRNAKISTARQVAAFIIRKTTNLSMNAIGETLGGRDHSTIVYAIQQIEDKTKTDLYLKNTIEDITKNIKNL